ncbi:hypothetical protein CYMTET_40466 [Cymbomonas tetramitiformis]|uniref:High light inducible protein n=1 Tax=Cymbomonas tetramitiformis TaxID=36881 RepID=A0AAE0C9E4_9CHLO|nr:hypothetical protein CYMTET_40466 [Cymbomonas tetramitiformis]
MLANCSMRQSLGSAPRHTLPQLHRLRKLGLNRAQLSPSKSRRLGGRYASLRPQAVDKIEEPNVLVGIDEAKIAAERQTEQLKREKFEKWLNDVETINGRWAMIGISFALVGEITTGQGLLHQVAQFLKDAGVFE